MGVYNGFTAKICNTTHLKVNKSIREEPLEHPGLEMIYKYLLIKESNGEFLRKRHEDSTEEQVLEINKEGKKQKRYL